MEHDCDIIAQAKIRFDKFGDSHSVISGHTRGEFAYLIAARECAQVIKKTMIFTVVRCTYSGIRARVRWSNIMVGDRCQHVLKSRMAQNGAGHLERNNALNASWKR